MYSADVSESRIIPTSPGVQIRSCSFTENIAGDIPLVSDTGFNIQNKKDINIQNAVRSKTGRGGAITAVMSKINIVNSTIANNMAIASQDSSLPAFAGAIFVDEISECSIVSSLLSDNLVLNGFGSDIVVVDVDVSSSYSHVPTSSLLDFPIKLFIRDSHLVATSDSCSLCTVGDLIDIKSLGSILSLGAKIEIGPGNTFTRTKIVAAGVGSELGHSLVGSDVNLRDAHISLNELSHMNDLSVVAWNATISLFTDKKRQAYSKIKPMIANLVILGGNLTSSNGLTVLGDLGIIEGTLDIGEVDITHALDVQGSFYSGFTDKMINSKEWVSF